MSAERASETAGGDGRERAKRENSPAEHIESLRDTVAKALAEDLGGGDVTSKATVPNDRRAQARIFQKAPGVVYGFEAVAETMLQCGVEQVDNLVGEGEWEAQVPLEVLLASGSARSLLAAERTALNFLGHLSGVATLTARFVEAVAGTGVKILDTRKTTPGLRALEKAAVAAGGGLNHRMGLYDAVLIKENHILVAGGIAKAINSARTAYCGDLEIEVEVRSPEEASQALENGADRLLLDNMDQGTLREVVRLREKQASPGEAPSLEASGGVTLETVRGIAETGVDFVSVGALTHSAPTLDFSLQLEPS